jgi:pimeloyl-ACP methyl ester carboxylesterase
MNKLRKSLLRIATAVLVVYLLVCVMIGFLQRKLLYIPTVLSPAQVDHLAQAAGLERWRNAAGEPVGLKRLSPRQPAIGKVLELYGNGSSATGCAHYADDIQRFAALDVFILDYPGYEDRPGKPTEKSLFQAANEALSLLGTNAPVYLLGESLGTHPDRIAGIVLIAPYNRLTDAAQYHYPILPVKLLMLDRFPSEDYLQSYHGPVGILVGGRDRVVPEQLGRRLYDGYHGPKQLWKFPHDGHGDLFQRLPDVWNQLANLWLLNQTNNPAK